MCSCGSEEGAGRGVVAVVNTERGGGTCDSEK